MHTDGQQENPYNNSSTGACSLWPVNWGYQIRPLSLLSPLPFALPYGNDEGVYLWAGNLLSMATAATGGVPPLSSKA